MWGDVPGGGGKGFSMCPHQLPTAPPNNAGGWGECRLLLFLLFLPLLPPSPSCLSLVGAVEATSHPAGGTRPDIASTQQHVAKPCSPFSCRACPYSFPFSFHFYYILPHCFGPFVLSIYLPDFSLLANVLVKHR